MYTGQTKDRLYRYTQTINHTFRYPTDLTPWNLQFQWCLKDALHKSGVRKLQKDATHDGLCTARIIDRYEKGDEECDHYLDAYLTDSSAET